MKLSSHADSLLGSLSVEEKVGQVFIFHLLNYKQAENALHLNPGGFVRIFSDVASCAHETERLQARSRIPLTMSADFERGIGSTVYGAIELAGNMCLGATGDEELAYETGFAIAQEACAIGVNTNYVPVLDVNVNEANPIINIRSFGADPELVARMGVAFIKGSQAGGVITAGKHFPGHGDTHTDSHSHLPVIEVSRERLDKVELVPFHAAIKAGVDMIMSGHLHVPALEPEPIPATMSRRIMHHLLREEMGFQGVVITDALDMGGVGRNFPPEVVIPRAFAAGCDQLLMPLDPERAVKILLDAIRRKEVSEQRLDEAVGRLLTLKERAGILDEPYKVPPDLAMRVKTPEHHALAKKVALGGLTLLKNDRALPIRPEETVAVITFRNSDDGRAAYMEPMTLGDHCAQWVRRVHAVDCGVLPENPQHAAHSLQKAVEAAASSDKIVVAGFIKVVMNRGSVMLEDRYVQFVEHLLALGKPVVMISFGNPYLIKQFGGVNAYVAAYGASDATQEAAAELLCGHAEFSGTLPVPITV